jgi:aminocarboxymuconate-semialdehyde decarboxylase
MRIDVHAHYLPASLVDLERGDPADQAFAVRITRPGSAEVLFAAEEVAQGYAPEQLYDLDRRRLDMQRQGVDMHVLSVPPPLNFFATIEPERALTICRVVNDAFARAVADDSEHFIGLATVPLQAPERAAVELERAVRELGLRGVEIGTNVDGTNLDEPGLRPFYAKAQELNVPIFIHSTGRKIGAERLSRYHFNNLVGNPTEDALAAGSLIFGGVLKEFPRLKVYIAHGGGSCPLLRGRWDHGWTVRPEARLQIQRPPSEYFSLLMFDSLTHSGPALSFLVETVGPERVMLGTDYPYDMRDADPVRSIAALPRLSDRERELIFGGNAAALFSLES